MRLLSRSILAGLLVSASPLFAGLATAYQDATHVYLENDALKIAFLRTNGSLDGIIHKQSGVNIQPNSGLDQGIWLLGVSQPSGTSVVVHNAQTTTFAATVETNPTEARLILTWHGLNPPGLPKMPDVIVTAEISVRADSPLSVWSFEMAGTGTSSVLNIQYPAIRGIDKLGQSGEDDQLLQPFQKGRLYHNPTGNLTSIGQTYPSGSQTMQFLAYFDTTSGIYIATDDTQGYTKGFAWAPSVAGDFSLSIASYPSPPSDTIKLPYHFIVGATQGDWYYAAEIYKNWAVKQPWAQQSRGRKVPTWLRDLALSREGWGYDYAGIPNQSYATFVSDIQRDKNDYGVSAMAQLRGWEKYGAFVYGDYFPPQEGWSGFDAMVQSLGPSKLWLFPSAFTLDSNTDLYRSGSLHSSAMVDAKGNDQGSAVSGCANCGRRMFMDFTTEPWAQYVVDTYATLAAHGAGLIQFDASMNNGPVACYNPAHSHPPGAFGNWQTLGWMNLASRVAGAVSAASPRAALSAEQPAEVYLPYFSLSFSSGQEDDFEIDHPSQLSVEPVPLINYVYHDSILFADTFEEPHVAVDDSYFLVRGARDLIWGQLPNVRLQPHPHDMDSGSMAYLQSAITARTTYARKFLVDGIMLPAPRLNVSTVAVSWRGPTQPVTGQFPSVQQSAWRAADGSVGIIMANITTNSLTFSLPVEYSRLSLPPGAAYTVQGTDGSTTTVLDSSLNKDSAYSITLKAAQVLLVTLTPKAPQPQISLGGVVTHASTSSTVSPGSLFDIYGANLASNSVTAPQDSQVLPSILGNVQVLVNGIPAPLLFAGPMQIVAQIPSSILIGKASVVVFRDGAASAAASVDVQQAAPNILTYGTNRAIVQNQDYSLNSSTNPAPVGSYATAYLIGSGPVAPIVADGAPAAASPLSQETLNTTVTVGGNPAKVLFAGMAPGFVGLVQVNFQVSDLPAGDYPIQVSIGTAQSNTPTITVGQ